jgi:hypothetical protein
MSMDIAEWLKELGLEQYEPAFRANEIDTRVLPSLTADDLKDLGVAGERGWDAEIRRLRGEFTGRLPHPDPAKAEDSFRTPSRSPASKAHGATNCAPPRASPGCGAISADRARRATFSHPSTPRSPRASTTPT